MRPSMELMRSARRSNFPFSSAMEATMDDQGDTDVGMDVVAVGMHGVSQERCGHGTPYILEPFSILCRGAHIVLAILPPM